MTPHSISLIKQAVSLPALGMHQARSYWAFLFAAGLGDDIRQEVELCSLGDHESVKAFSLAVNRNLYALARSAGFRKRHMNEMRDGLNWWHRPIISIEEAGPWLQRNQ